MFKRLKRKLKERKMKRIIKLAEDNGIYVPPTFERVGTKRRGICGIINAWYRSLEMRAAIAEREPKEKGIL